MQVGLSLAGGNLSEAGTRFARRLGVEDVVVHLTDYTRGRTARHAGHADIKAPAAPATRSAVSTAPHDEIAAGSR